MCNLYLKSHSNHIWFQVRGCTLPPFWKHVYIYFHWDFYKAIYWKIFKQFFKTFNHEELVSVLLYAVIFIFIEFLNVLRSFGLHCTFPKGNPSLWILKLHDYLKTSFSAHFFFSGFKNSHFISEKYFKVLFISVILTWIFKTTCISKEYLKSANLSLFKMYAL